MRESNDINKTAVSGMQEANQIAKRTLESSHRPWLQTSDISYEKREDKILILNANIKNYASYPALDVKVTFSMPDYKLNYKSRPWLSIAVMPGDVQKVSIELEISSRDPFIREIQEGKTTPILFSLIYKDDFGYDYSAAIEYSWDKNGFNRTKYKS